MKNTKGNKHLKNTPFMTLRGVLKDNYYVILERYVTQDCFGNIVSSNFEESLELDTAHAMLDGAIFRCEKDAETFLTKMIRNRIYNDYKELGHKRGSIPKEEIDREREYYRIMSIKEMFNPNRMINEMQERRKGL